MIDKKASILAAILVSGFALASGAISLSSSSSSDVVNTTTVNATTVNSGTGNFSFIDAGTVATQALHFRESDITRSGVWPWSGGQSNLVMDAGFILNGDMSLWGSRQIFQREMAGGTEVAYQVGTAGTQNFKVTGAGAVTAKGDVTINGNASFTNSGTSSTAAFLASTGGFTSGIASGSNALTLTTEGARVGCGPDTYFSESGTQCVASGDLTVTGRETHTIQALTCAAGAGACALTVTPSSSMITIDCQDVDTCDVTMSETGAVAGSRVCITIVGATGATDFADSAGVSELAGAFAAGIADTICMVYANSAWHEISRSNN